MYNYLHKVRAVKFVHTHIYQKDYPQEDLCCCRSTSKFFLGEQTLTSNLLIHFLLLLLNVELFIKCCWLILQFTPVKDGIFRQHILTKY